MARDKVEAFLKRRQVRIDAKRAATIAAYEERRRKRLEARGIVLEESRSIGTETASAPLRGKLELPMESKDPCGNQSLTSKNYSARMKSDDKQLEEIVCTDSDDICKAKDPSKCWKHGEEGRDRSMISRSAIKEIGDFIQDLKEAGVVHERIGTVGLPIPVKIEYIDDHASDRMKERGITREDAQSYIDNAMIMFNQHNETRRLYVSKDGNSAVLVEGNVLISTYSSLDFDDAMKRILSEVLKYV